jgi:hypothetical protein
VNEKLYDGFNAGRPDRPWRLKTEPPFPETAPHTFRITSATARAQRLRGPMDLVCKRIEVGRISFRSRDADLIATSFEMLVLLPNPQHPQPPPRVLRHHSSDDPTKTQSWGHGGSGAGDLALNVMAAYLPYLGGGAFVRLRDGSLVSIETHSYHRAFESAFLTAMPDEGGIVTEAEIRSWLSAQETRAMQIRLDLDR